MIGNEWRGRTRRYELPVVAPVRMEPKDVPLDPYALGLLLGDGSISSRATPAFCTADPELAVALEQALTDIELVRRSDYDYVLRHVHGHRGGVIVANPVTVALRELGLAGTKSGTKFVPDVYKTNSVEVRLAVLQGLLDTDGGPVTQDGRTCRVQYSTTSPRLRDDVVELVQSLGGVATWRVRPAEEASPVWRAAVRSRTGPTPTCWRSGCPPASRRSGWPASVGATTSGAVAGRCASSTRSSRPGCRRRCASRSRRRTRCT
ncbi:LAGLIDADG family homing endonuclease [Micromonospora zhanjiangensis]